MRQAPVETPMNFTTAVLIATTAWPIPIPMRLLCDQPSRSDSGGMPAPPASFLSPCMFVGISAVLGLSVTPAGRDPLGIG